MRCTLDYAIDDQDYGPGTAEVRAILHLATTIDWFELTSPAESNRQGEELFKIHNSLARSYAPELFAETLDFHYEEGGWNEFVGFCQAISGRPGFEHIKQKYGPRTEGNDYWKMDGLKRLIQQHKQLHDWTPEKHVARHPECIRVTTDGKRLWSNLWLLARLPGTESEEPLTCFPIGFELQECVGLSAQKRDAARWYVSFALGFEALYAIEWQLSDPTQPLAKNPYWAALQVYAAGFLPFYFSPEKVVLFRFSKRNDDVEDVLLPASGDLMPPSENFVKSGWLMRLRDWLKGYR